MSQFQTTAAYISGAICGPMWSGPKGAIPFRTDIRRDFKRAGDGATFRDVLLLLLAERGGDFQGAAFTADTTIRIERRTPCANGAYRVHVREREISAITDCADLADADAWTGDFMGDWDD